MRESASTAPTTSAAQYREFYGYADYQSPLLPPFELPSSDPPDMTYRSSSSRTVIDSPPNTPPSSHRHSALYLLHDSDYSSPDPLHGRLGSCDGQTLCHSSPISCSPQVPLLNYSSSSSPSEATRAGRRTSRGFRTTEDTGGDGGVQRLALGDLLVHMMSTAFLDDVDGAGQEVHAGRAGYGSRKKRPRDEQDDVRDMSAVQEGDYCRTSTPVDWPSADDGGYEGDVSMSESQMRAAMTRTVSCPDSR